MTPEQENLLISLSKAVLELLACAKADSRHMPSSHVIQGLSNSLTELYRKGNENRPY